MTWLLFVYMVLSNGTIEVQTFRMPTERLCNDVANALIEKGMFAECEGST